MFSKGNLKIAALVFAALVVAAYLGYSPESVAARLRAGSAA